MNSNLNFFQKIAFVFNVLFGVFLLLAYILPLVPPRFSAFLSILNLGLPVFMLINIGFLVYWILRLKLHFLFSGILVLSGYSYINKIVVFNSSEASDIQANLSVMSYNVRLFNAFQWIEDDHISEKISNFIAKESPDIIAFQDYQKVDDFKLTAYPYHFEKFKTKSSKIGIAIFSKYEIINQGAINFPNTHNNAIYADIVVNQDTLRVYAVHLESLKIIPDVDVLQQENHQQLISRVGKSFVKQQDQMEMVLDNFESVKYPKLVCIDINNTAFSYVANQLLKHNLKDAFVESGQGLGKTFDFDFLPLRIDAIFNDKSIQNLTFKNYDLKLSDHYPIMANFKL